MLIAALTRRWLGCDVGCDVGCDDERYGGTDAPRSATPVSDAIIIMNHHHHRHHHHHHHHHHHQKQQQQQQQQQPRGEEGGAARADRAPKGPLPPYAASIYAARAAVYGGSAAIYGRSDSCMEAVLPIMDAPLAQRQTACIAVARDLDCREARDLDDPDAVAHARHTPPLCAVRYSHTVWRSACAFLNAVQT
eukprot:1472200-Rhodomonas_salina.3